MKTALLVRLDKIGDLVLTLPADQQYALADYRCFWLISKGMGFLPKHSIPERTFFEITPHWNKTNWVQLWNILNAVRPEVSVSFQAPWWINLAFFLFGVKKRVGVLSKWHSFLFLNAGVRQKRSQADWNELEYNHQLVHQGLKDSEPIQYPFLKLKAPPTALPNELPPIFAVIHPGMAGSARNWPANQYIELIELLRKKNIPVVITGTKADAAYVDPLKKKLHGEPHILWWNEQLNISQLLLVLSKATHVIAPSTGVLHLAAALGTSVTGIYSPVRVQQVKRWGPQGPAVQTRTPLVECPGQFYCLREKCPSFDCMALVSSTEILQTISLAHSTPEIS